MTLTTPLRDDLAAKRPRGRPGKKGAPPVVLVISAASRPLTALVRAKTFADRMGAPLYVVGGLAPLRGAGVLFPQRRSGRAVEDMNEVATSAKRLWRWCNKNLVTSLAPEAVQTARGHLGAIAAGAARRLKAQLLVLADGDGASGADVTAIVEDCDVSVLLSRAVQAKNVVVAATDLSLERRPVVREGATIGEILHAPVTFLHKVPREWVGTSKVGPKGELLFPVPIREERKRWRREYRLGQASKAVGGGFETKVVGHVDTAAAILGFAREQEADLIVVGHRARGWLDRAFHPGVAKAVVAKARRSVVVVPAPRRAARAGRT